jgi:YfiH family protein
MTPPTTHAVEAGSVRGLPVVTWPSLDGHQVDVFVTTRDGGGSTGPYASLNLGLHVGDDDAVVVANRRTVAQAMDADLADFVFADQVHGTGVQVVTDADRGRGTRSLADAVADTDALVTDIPGLVLAIMVADCVPIVLFDPVRRVLSCVHAGWPGTVRDVAGRAVATMRQLGTDPADVVVGVGPSIAPDRYQVGRDVVEAAARAFPETLDQVVRPDGTGAWTFDLWRANTLQLMAAGVPEGQVHLAGLDTGPGTPFFSHRSAGPCGRFAVFARLAEASR